MIRKQLGKMRDFVLLRIPPQYAESFMETLMSENLDRIVVGGVIISLIELGVFLTGARRFAETSYYPLGAVLFNVLVIPLLIVLKRRAGGIRHKRAIVYLVVAFYLFWSCFYTWAVRANRPLLEVNIPLYMLMVYGTAIFIYMEPIWSAGLFAAGLGLFVVLMPMEAYDQWAILGNVWNALALNLFAWVTSRLIFGFQMRTFVAQKELEQARAKSDALLLNILPAQIATDLKETGQTTPERFDQVTVLFSDLVDFTTISSQLAPEVLIGELNDLFTAFDAIVERFQCERIKTIGDAYLCVCGMPQAHPHHAEQILRAALEMVAYLQQRNTTHPHPWQIRLGIHSGSVVGGVVGTQKYIYDVFGDTINTAVRMQQHAAPMQINVSETTYRLARERFLFIERGLIPVKGKGDVPMYYLRGVAQEP